MGSFNETCGVSGLPIAYDQPCRMFVIRPHWYTSLHYQSKWEPVTIVPVKGPYNDYGGLDIDQTPAIQMQHKTLHASSRPWEKERCRNERHIKELDTRFDAIYRLCERGALEVKTPHGIFVSAPFFVREDVYQNILDRQRNGATDYWGRNIEQWATDLAQMRLDTHVKYRELMRKGKETGVFDHESMVKVQHDLDKVDGQSRGQYLASRLIQDHEDLIFSDEHARASLKEAMVEFELFAMGMEGFSKWHPPGKYHGVDVETLYNWHLELAEMAMRTIVVDFNAKDDGAIRVDIDRPRMGERLWLVDSNAVEGDGTKTVAYLEGAGDEWYAVIEEEE